jgi:hypothetical protein
LASPSRSTVEKNWMRRLGQALRALAYLFSGMEADREVLEEIVRRHPILAVVVLALGVPRG